MKKIVLVICMASLLLLTACNSNKSEQASQNVDGQNNMRIQREMPDLIGEISAINNNEITLKLIEMPENINIQSQESQQPQDGQPSQGNGQFRGGNNGSGRQRPDGSAVTRTAPSGGSTGGQRQLQGQEAQETRQAFSPNYTGETKVITIPAEIKVTSSEFINGSRMDVEVALTELKIGEMLSITYSDKENETIDKVSVTAIMGARIRTDDAQ